MGDLAAYAALFAAALAAATILPMQSEAAVAGLILTGDYPVTILIAVAGAGNVLGSAVNWLLGRGIERFKGRPWFPANPAMVARAAGWYHRYGRWSLLLSWVPVIGDPLTVVGRAAGAALEFSRAGHGRQGRSLCRACGGNAQLDVTQIRRRLGNRAAVGSRRFRICSSLTSGIALALPPAGRIILGRSFVSEAEMNIGTVSEKSGLPAKTIRYYEDIGLLKPDRAGNGYRDYSKADLHRLRFLQRSRSLGFSVEECRQLLSLYGNDERESADVKAIAKAKLADIDRKIAELVGLRDMLRHLVKNCHGDSRPDCPIIDGLAGEETVQ